MKRIALVLLAALSLSACKQTTVDGTFKALSDLRMKDNKGTVVVVAGEYDAFVKMTAKKNTYKVELTVETEKGKKTFKGQTTAATDEGNGLTSYELSGFAPYTATAYVGEILVKEETVTERNFDHDHCVGNDYGCVVYSSCTDDTYLVKTYDVSVEAELGQTAGNHLELVGKFFGTKNGVEKRELIKSENCRNN